MNYCLCDTTGQHPVSECIPPWKAPTEVQQDDVRYLLQALGLGDHARPYSPHAVIHREILPAIKALADARHRLIAEVNDWPVADSWHRDAILQALGGA